MPTETLLSLELSEPQFNEISNLVKSLCGINLHDGKKELVKARLTKRPRQLNLCSFAEYMDYVRGDTGGTELTNMLDALEDHWIDLVFADINMPVMDGEEMIDEIRKQPEWEELPIVVVSTEGSATRIERLQQKGASFVHKPFTPESIQEVIKKITGVSHEQKV